MKRLNKNVVIFIITFSIILSGLFSVGFIKGMYRSFGDLMRAFLLENAFTAFDQFTANIETASSQGLLYHKEFVDINSSVQKSMGTAVIYKDDMTVVRSKNGYLSYVRDVISEDKLKKRAKNVAELYNAASENGSDFLYVIAPAKGYDMEYPDNIIDYNKLNCDTFINELEDANVPYYNIFSQMKKEGITEEDMFFITDHHWKPEYALWAVNRVVQELNARFGFEYNEENLDINNYNEKVYKNWFLGSQGKKTGQYFTPLGLDDISIFTPKFKTFFVNTQVGKDYSVQGSFEEVLIHKEHVEEKDLYNKNPYATYLGGDYREQVIENKGIEDGKRILILKDSFACAFVPFLSTVTKETCLLDMRDFDEFAGDRIDVANYIKETKPDIVLVMYSGVTSEDKLYEFN